MEQQRLQPDEWKQKFEETETGWKKNGFLVVPESLEKKVMRLTHGEELESHAGAAIMTERLKEYGYYIKNAQKKATEFIKECGLCQKMRGSLLLSFVGEEHIRHEAFFRRSSGHS
ncbi:hypothetical protein ADUPG1_005711, partial [Aduncisulcus paluster]